MGPESENVVTAIAWVQDSKLFGKISSWAELGMRRSLMPPKTSGTVDSPVDASREGEDFLGAG